MLRVLGSSFLLVLSISASASELMLSTFLGEKYIGRDKWGAMVSKHSDLACRGRLVEEDCKELATFHHTSDIVAYRKDGSPSLKAEKKVVKAVDDYCVNNRGWPDIGYHFLVGLSGRVYEGRPYKYRGAHTKDLNSKNIGIAFIGCFDEVGCTESGLEVTEVTDELIDSTVKLLVVLSLKDDFKISKETVIPRSVHELAANGRSRFPHI